MKLPYKVREDLIKWVEDKADEIYEGCQNNEDYPSELGTHLRDGLMSTVHDIEVSVDTEVKCTCPTGLQKTLIVNHSPMWGDGDVICTNCGGFVRYYDAG